MNDMIQRKYPWLLLFLFLMAKTAFGSHPNPGDTCAPCVTDPLQDLAITATTGEKPQSKVWFYDSTWWAVLPNGSGTELWHLTGTRWVDVLHLSDSTHTMADTRPVGNVTHILLFHGPGTELVSVEYDRNKRTYHLWSKRPGRVQIPLERYSETATIEVDPSGRMWLASDAQTEVHVRWSDPPYAVWSKPLTLATGISGDDIAAVTSFPDGNIGVLWSNQVTKRFGFRMHLLNTAPGQWTADEVPASASAIPWKDGMADDHINMAVASDGTLYAAVKTSYDTKGYPLVAMLVRRPSGKWDKLYRVDDEGSRGIVLLNEAKGCVMVIYSSYRDRQIVCKTSAMNKISFGERKILMNTEHTSGKINNATSTKQNIGREVVVLASEPGMARSVRLELNFASEAHLR